MGYLAPINNYQYQQYAERVTMKSYDPYYLTPVQRISPYDRSAKEFQDHFERELEVIADRSDKIQKKKLVKPTNEPSISPIIATHIIPKFTGKGLHFNETI